MNFEFRYKISYSGTFGCLYEFSEILTNLIHKKMHISTNYKFHSASGRLALPNVNLELPHRGQESLLSPPHKENLDKFWDRWIKKKKKSLCADSFFFLKCQNTLHSKPAGNWYYYEQSNFFGWSRSLEENYGHMDYRRTFTIQQYVIA